MNNIRETTADAPARMHKPDAHPSQPHRPTFGELLQEVMNLTAGLSIALLPLLTIAVPGVILFFVLPAILLLALTVPLAAIGAVIALPPYLLARWLRRRRRRTVSSAARPMASVAAVGQKER